MSIKAGMRVIVNGRQGIALCVDGMLVRVKLDGERNGRVYNRSIVKVA
jgi:hypothetical protein